MAGHAGSRAGRLAAGVSQMSPGRACPLFPEMSGWQSVFSKAGMYREQPKSSVSLPAGRIKKQHVNTRLQVLRAENCCPRRRSTGAMELSFGTNARG